jgi:hypothetical protein
MHNRRAYRWVTVAVGLGLALAVGLAAGCYGRDPLNPNLVPDSLHRDSTQNQGLLIPPSSHSGTSALV